MRARSRRHRTDRWTTDRLHGMPDTPRRFPCRAQAPARTARTSERPPGCGSGWRARKSRRMSKRPRRSRMSRCSRRAGTRLQLAHRRFAGRESTLNREDIPRIAIRSLARVPFDFKALRYVRADEHGPWSRVPGCQRNDLARSRNTLPSLWSHSKMPILPPSVKQFTTALTTCRRSSPSGVAG